MGAVASSSAPAAGAAGHGSVIAVWGPTGAPGRTTIAITIAAELAAAGRSVVLVDADSYGGAVACRLGLPDEASGLVAACRLAESERLERAALVRVAYPVSVEGGSLRVLTGISSPALWPELSERRMAALLPGLALLADHVVVDLGFNLEADEEIVSDLFAPRRNAATLTVLRSADRVVAVGAADPLGLARLVDGQEALNSLAPSARRSVVLNRARGERGAARLAQLAGDLGRLISAVVPDDPEALAVAVGRALPLTVAAPGSPAAQALSGLVRDELLAALPGVGRQSVRVRAAAS